MQLAGEAPCLMLPTGSIITAVAVPGQIMSLVHSNLLEGPLEKSHGDAKPPPFFEKPANFLEFSMPWGVQARRRPLQRCIADTCRPVPVLMHYCRHALYAYMYCTAHAQEARGLRTVPPPFSYAGPCPRKADPRVSALG